MSAFAIVIVALAAGLAAFLFVRTASGTALRKGARGSFPVPEALLLEEAVVTEPIAPGLEGKAELRKRGSKPLPLRARAMDSDQAFVRGAKVRVIDFREGCCYVENADEVHLVR